VRSPSTQPERTRLISTAAVRLPRSRPRCKWLFRPTATGLRMFPTASSSIGIYSESVGSSLAASVGSAEATSIQAHGRPGRTASLGIVPQLPEALGPAEAQVAGQLQPGTTGTGYQRSENPCPNMADIPPESTNPGAGLTAATRRATRRAVLPLPPARSARPNAGPGRRATRVAARGER
jgi:hypothetical protein